MSNFNGRKDIKNLRPNPNSRYYQGYFDVYRPRKYLGRYPIIYRSALEWRFMYWCEMSPSVTQWGSETLAIPYYFKGARHMYNLDFSIINSQSQKIIIEVKPKSFIPLNEEQKRINPIMAKNAAKWDAAIDFCKRHPNTYFKIITEDFFNETVIKVPDRPFDPYLISKRKK